jgi:putative transposase
VHLLVRSGIVPLATLMRRLLTGYAIYFNRRYRRHGQLFQNRYKSILCQEDLYLLELVRYIHLNPLRAGIVRDLKALDSYAHTGHATLMGKQEVVWQDCGQILRYFASKKTSARKKYREFVEKGADLGRRPDLVGGGLIRSMGGWQQVKKAMRGINCGKGDERILGDSDFVLNILAQCNEKMERGYQLAAKGIDMDALARYGAGLFNLEASQVMAAGRYPTVVQARSLLCYWAVRELGITAADLARKIVITQPAVSISVKRGEKIAQTKGFKLDPLLN